MEHNKKKTTVQGIAYVVPVDERSGRANSPRWSTDDRLIFSECQIEKRNLASQYMNLNLRRQMKDSYGTHRNRQKIETKYLKQDRNLDAHGM
jgi:hypothetical protein